MDNVLRMAMINCLEQLLHVRACLLFSERLVVLFADFVVQRKSCDHFHDQVNVLLVIVRLIVLDDVGMVERIQCLYFLHNVVEILTQFALIEHFDCNLDASIKTILGLEDASKGPRPQNLRMLVNYVVLLQLSDALLFEGLPSRKLLLSSVVVSWWLL